MIVYRIVVAYDGTAYSGWQAQSGVTTVAQTLQDAFKKVFFQEVHILGASRTDAGVHALGQVAIMRCPIFVDPEIMLRAWSKAVPEDITIRSIEHLEKLVHPHDGVVQKTYQYHVFLERPLPFYQRFGWFIYKPVDLDILKSALKVFVGTHDFRSFCTGDDLVDTVRTIDSIELIYVSEWNAYRIEVKGKSFLRYMVRRIVGACLEVSLRSHLTLNSLKAVLESKNPCHTLPNAPAKGLVLKEIIYDDRGKGERQ
jgi:tRNA pseudouridine38-40 synthase